MKLSIIIPCFNEEEGIDALVAELNRYFQHNKTYEHEVIFVDDGSVDRTSEKLKEAQHIHYSARLVKLASNAGSHNAFRAGLMFTTGDYITLLSADLQHPLELVHQQLDAALRNQVKLVLAQRVNHSKRRFMESLFSGFTIRMIRKYAVKDYPEDGCDIFMISREIGDLLKKHEEGNTPVILQILHFGFRYTAIKYEKLHRYAGRSKWTFSKKIKLFIDSILGFSYAPMRAVTSAGVLFFIAGVMWTLAIVVRKIVFDDLVQGWALLSSILFIGFGVTNISLGVIAEYLWRTFDASRQRPAYVIDESTEINPSKSP